MKKGMVFAGILVLFLGLIGYGFASDPGKLTNVSGSNIASQNSSFQKITIASDGDIRDPDADSSDNHKIELARRGCCSHHGGVCGCDEAKDRIICCDGTLSPSCTCSGY